MVNTFELEEILNKIAAFNQNKMSNFYKIRIPLNEIAEKLVNNLNSIKNQFTFALRDQIA